VVDVVGPARQLIAEVSAQPWGQISPSVYETGRLVTLAPWLVGHSERVEYLLSGQHRDGSWGGSDGYALVPTLSATEALLATIRNLDAGRRADADQRFGYGALVDAADKGLRALFGWVQDTTLVLPDTPAIEIIVPALVSSLNQHLARYADTAPKGLDAWRGSAGLPLPAGVTTELLTKIQRGVASGTDVPDKLLHSFEVVGNRVGRAARVRLVPPGTVGASPAATAAWLASRPSPERAGPAGRYLNSVVERLGAAVPSVIPVTIFERAWVLSTLLGAGVPIDPPAELVSGLKASLGPRGTPGGAGLPEDADTTSVVLLTLAQLGVRSTVDCLWAYETDTHFCTWQGERSFSTTVNAHILEAFGYYAVGGSVIAKLSRWLASQQLANGSWVDKWHSSPYYATACCALALHRHGVDASAAVRRAVDWVLATQRPDGSWGRWRGTAEETALAMQVLLPAGTVVDPAAQPAARRGYGYLLRSIDRNDDPPLWHDKDLYRPVAVVRANILAALHLAQRHVLVDDRDAVTLRECGAA